MLVHTNEEGEVREMKAEDIEDFAALSTENAELYAFMSEPWKLEQIDMPNEKRFVKAGLRFINNMLKRLGTWHKSRLGSVPLPGESDGLP